MRIVICDDEKYFADEIEEICKNYFEKIGEECEIIQYLSGQTFLECEDRADVLFLDINLEDMNGLEVAHTVNVIRKWHTYIVYVTSHMEYMQDAFDIYVVDFLEKPVNESKIQRVFSKIFERKKGKEYYVVSWQRTKNDRILKN